MMLSGAIENYGWTKAIEYVFPVRLENESDKSYSNRVWEDQARAIRLAQKNETLKFNAFFTAQEGWFKALGLL